MAGFVVALNSKDALAQLASEGAYGTVLSQPKGYWGVHHEGTFADYAGMRDGDHIYFFIDRRLYGIGRLVEVGGSCRHQNFVGASSLAREVAPAEVGSSLLFDNGNPGRVRWILTFRPDPYLFTLGVDMDDALIYRPNAFRMLRSFWRRSFIKVDDEEDQALTDLILRANRDFIGSPRPGAFFPDNHVANHASISARLRPEHTLDSRDIVKLAANGRALAHEMALEAALVYQLTERDPGTEASFGRWDYVTHQLVASPPKPPDYNDWIDVYGTATVLDTKTIGTYFVAELKKGTATGADVAQVMKYVDWVKDEYCFGDYSLIKAFLVASEFLPSVGPAVASEGHRFFTKGRRPPKTVEWGGLGELSLVRYEAQSDGSVTFDVVPAAP